jgi:hypothetical protein
MPVGWPSGAKFQKSGSEWKETEIVLKASPKFAYFGRTIQTLKNEIFF